MAPQNAGAASSAENALEATIDSMALAAADVPPGASPTASQPVGRNRFGGVARESRQLSNETHRLLRARLRIASIILGSGFVLFLIWKVFLWPHPKSPGEFAQFLEHIAITLVLGFFAVTLCRRCSLPLGYLRFVELLTFGLPAVFFATHWCFTFPEQAAAKGYVAVNMGGWIALLSAYGMFIPNTVPRAAAVLGILAATPLVVLEGLRWWFPLVARHVGSDVMLEVGTMQFICWLAGVYSAHMVGSLRSEAFEARRFGQYQLKRLLGQGGMGEVYLAEHHLLKRPCAIKLIHPDRAGDPRALARFEREVRATAKLTHWNSIEIFDYGQTEDGTFYYVMEYLPGMSLAELVDKFGPLPPERVVYLIRQICEALAEAHSMGLIHRDIKPGNIYAALRGGVFDVAKLLDFGLVKMSERHSDAEVTLEQTITGSPLFMSPEQGMNEKVDARCDIYSLGAVMYFLLTGRPPFMDDNPIKVVVAHASKAVEPPSKLRADVPADLEAIVLKCLAKRPEDRYECVWTLEETLAETACANRWNRTLAQSWWEDRGLLSGLKCPMTDAPLTVAAVSAAAAAVAATPPTAPVPQP